MTELLGSEPLIIPTPESSIRAGFDALVERLGIRPTIAVEADDMAILRLIARERTGLAVLPPIVVRDELASGELQEAGRLPGLVQPFHAVTVARHCVRAARKASPLAGMSHSCCTAGTSALACAANSAACRAVAAC